MKQITISDLFDQAQQLSRNDRRELAKLLIDSLLDDTHEDEETWDEEELAELMTIEPMTGEEIVAAGLTGVWKDLNIPDGVTWVEEQRRKRRERRKHRQW